MKTKRVLYIVCILFSALLWVGCASPTREDISEETPVPPTATAIPVTKTAVPTHTPIPPPPTKTPEPTPTPVDPVTIAEVFVLALNQGEDLSDYVADEASVVVEGDAPILVETMADFVDYSREAGSRFVLNECQKEETAVTCTATETNEWLPIYQEYLGESSEPLAYEKFRLTMTGAGRITSLTLALEPDAADPITDFFVQFDDWLNVNEVSGAEGFFTEANQLVYNEEHGAQMVDLIQEYVAVMGQLSDLYLSSEEAYAAGDYETAIALYTDILAFKLPSNIQYVVLSLRADGHDQLGNYKAAIVDYEAAVALNDEDPKVLNNLCWDYALTEQPELALPYCERSIALEPRPNSLDSRGLVHGLLGDYEAAIADFEVVVTDLESTSSPNLVAIREQRTEWIDQMRNEQNPFTPEVMAELRGEELPPPPVADPGNDPSTGPTTAQDYFNMGKRYEQQGEYRLAIEAYSQAIALAPQTADYYAARGALYAMVNEPEKLLADFDQAIALGTQDGVVYFFRGYFYAATGENEQAISHIEKGIELGLPPELKELAESILSEIK